MEEYCRQKAGPYMEDKVSSTCKVEVADTRESSVSHILSGKNKKRCVSCILTLKVATYPAELLPHLPTSAFSPPPLKSTPPAPPTIFRPPGLEEPEEEVEETDEATETPQYPNLCTPFPPVPYPSMLRLLHPHLYRNHLNLYHPYFPQRYYHHSK